MPSYYRNRVRLLIAILAACVLFTLVGRWAGIPREPGFEPALSVAPGAAGRMLVVLLTLAAASGVTTVLVGRVRLEAGLFAAAVGLCALSIRGGPMRYVWTHEDASGLPYRLAVELALLGFTLAAMWSAVRSWMGQSTARTIVPSFPAKAFAIHFVVTGACCVLLLMSDDKKQALIGIAFASCIGCAIASAASPTPVGNWIWLSPIAVGVVGYVAFALSGIHGSPNGAGWLAHLAQASPLDYAGAGTAGAILGSWMGFTRDEPAQPPASAAVAG